MSSLTTFLRWPATQRSLRSSTQNRSFLANCDEVLLDECVPRNLKSHLPGVECQTVPEAGLAGKKNGELSSLAESGLVFRYFSPSTGALSTNKICCIEQSGWW